MIVRKNSATTYATPSKFQKSPQKNLHLSRVSRSGHRATAASQQQRTPPHPRMPPERSTGKSESRSLSRSLSREKERDSRPGDVPWLTLSEVSGRGGNQRTRVVSKPPAAQSPSLIKITDFEAREISRI